MKLTGDYHTHTLYSHGKGTVEESVLVAISKGLHVIAISEHSYGHLFFGVKRKELFRLIDEIESLRKKYPQINIKCGLEANILNVEGDIDVDDELLNKLDFIMAGYHFGSAPKRLFRDGWHHIANYLVKWLPLLKKGCVHRNTQAVVNAMKRYPLFAITHPGAKGPIDIHEVAKVAFLQGTLLEINTHHGHLSVDEIRVAKRQNARFIISSDAHSHEDVGSVDEALARAIKAGLNESDIYNVAI
jgi:putative hydrolase